ncbi:MarR family transcriptional regulator [Microbacterium sp. EYE_5]|uniref:MarR family winged helix-turn-helix transcriptional regulator n=1 Tax=unclassified Microbacterium TaxID=2609290 RepID=UPI0020037453|nr:MULTISPECIES: MarR family transcriptional regulator [unclassified Microbacterium]MCK6079252.1 MarR family transcriptional regulator [Microbacterium sp. EYE_382]MCK6084522.1 MarR family transcriptional regulator [Microbacterium sp. EYE_384]MCK6123249.1 MarR family transcriptional regulator [Microbacterium sp. EYE_80]MCK6125286.1 MarR family transcriptional regulator [Microbacterium sp. EYE_79]MCK6140206.1 MarR family transcriptional regulator [Microbacterium sp. EYE_39]
MAAADDLPPDALATWSSLATLLEWLPAALDAQLQRDAGLTHFEYGILYALSHADDGRLRMSTLAGYAHSSLSRLSRAATRLEARGYLRRETDPDDGRYTVAILTDEGAAARRAAGPGHVELVNRLVLERLTVAQQRQLGVITGRILTAIGDEPGWNPVKA